MIRHNLQQFRKASKFRCGSAAIASTPNRPSCPPLLFVNVAAAASLDASMGSGSGLAAEGIVVPKQTLISISLRFLLSSLSRCVRICQVCKHLAMDEPVPERHFPQCPAWRPTARRGNPNDPQTAQARSSRGPHGCPGGRDPRLPRYVSCL